jgi:hypothetical protein
MLASFTKIGKQRKTMKLRLSLVEDWHKAWKWSSMRFMGVTGIAELVLHYFKDLPQEVAQYIDPHVLSWIATGSFLLAGLGRITQLEKPNDVQPPPASK